MRRSLVADTRFVARRTTAVPVSSPCFSPRGSRTRDTSARQVVLAVFFRGRGGNNGAMRRSQLPSCRGHHRNYGENEGTKATSVPRDGPGQFVLATKRGETSWSESSDRVLLYPSPYPGPPVVTASRRSIAKRRDDSLGLFLVDVVPSSFLRTPQRLSYIRRP